MPELPEVETVRRGLEPAMTGASVLRLDQRRKDLRFVFPERFRERVEGHRVVGLRRRAKYILADLSSGEALLMHLGMSGRFRVLAPKGGTQRPGKFHHEAPALEKHDHVVFDLSNGYRVIYNDARRFGFMDLIPEGDVASSAYLAGLGIEPLGNALSAEALAGLFGGRRTPLKAALLDQRLIAGLGNIYACEALFRAGLDPCAPAGILALPDGAPAAKAALLAQVIRDVLHEALEAGGSTLRDFAHADGSLGYFQHRFKVYDREGEPCAAPGCGDRVQRLVQAGRSTFFCATCQSPARTLGG